MPETAQSVKAALCPACKRQELPPGRTVCSPACRTRRWREQRAAGLADLRGQLVALREHLDRALAALPEPGEARRRRG